ncbi:hypothetical protein ACFY13_32675 [Streptomyces mirabilis]|uniref:hypothetical protein n=1 Tax=Streptomyces mirabilis TaxID=68239 RepID=UPI0036BBA35B
MGYNAFGLQESDDADLPVPFPDDFDYDTFLSTHPGRWTSPAVATPTLPPSRSKCGTARRPNKTQPIWDEQAEADFESTSGQVAVWSMSLGRADDVITLADSGGAW